MQHGKNVGLADDPLRWTTDWRGGGKIGVRVCLMSTGRPKRESCRSGELEKDDGVLH